MKESTDDVFDELLGRHLELSQRGFGSDQDFQLRVQNLLEDIERAFSSGRVTGEPAARLLTLAGLWRVHLARGSTSGALPVIGEGPDQTFGVGQVVRGLSRWQLAGMVAIGVAILLGALWLGRWWGSVAERRNTEAVQLRLDAATGALSTEAARNDGLEAQVAAERETFDLERQGRLRQLQRSREETRLLALLIELSQPLPRRSRRDAAARQIYARMLPLLREMEVAGQVVVVRDRSRGTLRIELLRTRDIWEIPAGPAFSGDG